ncbi:ankyrin repeat protein [Colletotrichum truncatum]|uniref:Ankyrin repeat protein n=1 Tax=Colletotrichum truncatum TaxID=5467 RepID=A0ACC3YVS0_COLTU|nr:ankyrin repeat protein [Colletotrichum truncatum]KAF6791301.1 ankyrin repeat protein [Colletotrichum truncatum]
MSDPRNYTVGWICAISTEFVAARAFLDEVHDGPTEVARNDSNSYALGQLGNHNVVIAVLPDGEYGTTSAAVVARDMLHSFPNIRIGLMVGIGGGAPSSKHDIRHGDIVVSSPRNGTGGVLQYDFGKSIQSQAFQETGFQNQPPTVLRTAVSGLRAMYEADGHQLDEDIKTILGQKPRLRKKYARPQPGSDRLYKSDIVHPPDTEGSCAEVCGNDPSQLKQRGERDEYDDNPMVHYGLIGSANQLMKDALLRDKLAAEKNVLCFEMEAAGLMNHFPCLVIRGICDYSDSHKNDEWHGFAAMAAAAYAKDLLRRIPPNKVEAETRVKEVLESLGERLDQIGSATGTIRTMVDSMSSDSHMEKFKIWLSPPDTSNNVNHARESRHEGTGSWFLNSTIFQEWKLGTLQHLWLHGLPGCGKTVLATTILDHVAHLNDRVTVDFFFDFSDATKQKPEDMCRSLAFQLYARRIEARKELDDLFKSHQSNRKQPTTQMIFECFQKMLQGIEKLCIIVDAVDECIKRTELLKWIQSIVSNPNLAHVQFLVTGRSEEEFVRGFKSIFGENNCIPLEKDSVNADIRSYISARLKESEEFKKWASTPSVLQSIQDEIGHKADGMFRWAACQLDSLEACLDREELQTALKSLPKDLDATYSRIIQNIPQHRKNKAIRLLQFLVCADRALTLQEAVDLIAVRIESGGGFNPEDRLPDPEDITRFCPSLITLVEASNFVKARVVLQLAHFSVKEYLLRHDAERFTKIGPSITITRTCLTYLTSVNKDVVGEILSQFPLAPYAAEILMQHAKPAESLGDVAAAMVCFLQNPTTLQMWATLSRSDYPQVIPAVPEASSLYYASEQGLVATVKRLLSTPIDVNAKGGPRGNALCAAMDNREAEIVRMLLENGADANSQGSWYGSILCSAVGSQEKEITKMLLDRGADVNAQDSQFGNALCVAVVNQDKDIIQMLLDKGADVNARGRNFVNAICVAVIHQNKEIIQMLLDKGADVEAQDGYYRDTLHATFNS